MVDYWAKYGRFMNKYDRFNFLNERIDEIEGGGDSGLGDRVTAIETRLGTPGNPEEGTIGFDVYTMKNELNFIAPYVYDEDNQEGTYQVMVELLHSISGLGDYTITEMVNQIKTDVATRKQGKGVFEEIFARLDALEDSG